MQRLLFVFILVGASLLALTRCGPNDGSEADDVVASFDGGTVPDAGPPQDSGAGADAGVDAGTTPDSVAAPDAGPRLDAGTVFDAGMKVDAGAVASHCPPGAWCDDFEGYDAGKAPWGRWKTLVSNGTVAVDSTRSVSGRQSVRMNVTAGSGRAAVMTLTGAPTFPIPGNNLFGRARMFIPELPADGVHYDFITGAGTSTAAGGQTLVRYGGMNTKHFLANYWETPTSADCWKNATVVVPEGKWACVEWQFDGSKNDMRLWVDGVAITSATVSGMGDGCVGRPNQTWHLPTFSTLEVGWRNWQPTTKAYSMWVDDFAVGSSRLGCAP